MNSPTTTPIRAKEIAGVSEAKTHAMVDGITTVRVNLPLAGPKQLRFVDKSLVD